MIRVVILEDDHFTRRLIAAAMRERDFEVYDASDAHACKALLARQRVEAVVVDLGLPGLDGLSYAAQLREHNDVGVLIVTRNDTSKTRIEALNLGADDYLTKPVDFDELAARIRSVVRRRYPARGRRLKLGRWQIDLDARTAICGQESAELTRGEFEILARLIEAKSKIVAREELQATIGRQPESDLRSVDSLISRLRRKLDGGRDSSKLIVTAPGFGYRLREAAAYD